MMSSLRTPELFRNFPELRERLPWTSLARATPTQCLSRLESYLRRGSIWVKRDDETSDICGGAKARALEFVFGEALRRGARRLLWFGKVGQPYGLALSAFARHFELHPILALRGRAAGPQVERTLRLQHELGAEMHRFDGGPQALWRLGRSILASSGESGDSRLPYVVWPRRAQLYAALGFVNAAYELQRQIAVGVLPRPERIYVPLGSGAALSGLLLGCELAGVETRLVGVGIGQARPRAIVRMARRAARHLAGRCKGFPQVRLGGDQFELRRVSDAARASAGPQRTLGLVRDLENLELEAQFTARTLAALLDDVRNGVVEGPVLYWHTYDARHLQLGSASDSSDLPRALREFVLPG